MVLNHYFKMENLSRMQLEKQIQMKIKKKHEIIKNKPYKYDVNKINILNDEIRNLNNTLISKFLIK